MPASNDVRVRVDGLLEQQRDRAALERARGRAALALSASARSSSAASSARGQLRAGEEVARQARRYALRRPKPRSISSARSPTVPGFGSTPSWTAAP